jgi:hypothetical protein
MLCGSHVRVASIVVELEEYGGVPHQTFGMGKAVANAKAALNEVARKLHAAFSQYDSGCRRR